MEAHNKKKEPKQLKLNLEIGYEINLPSYDFDR